MPWTCLPPLSAEQHTQFMRRAVFHCCKWHVQVEDQPIFCPFPLVISSETWRHLASLAEALATETLNAERELLDCVELHDRLGLPKSLRRCLRRAANTGPTSGGPRVMRFDFHRTTDGWNISEANTDVAGGYIEGSGLSQLMAEYYPDCEMAGDPAGALSEAALRRVGAGSTVGLMHLTVYSEDRQVMLYLAKRLTEVGLVPRLVGHEQLHWVDGYARIVDRGTLCPVDLVVRFYPAEWLDRLSSNTRWECFAAGGKTPTTNPAYAVLTQSKRFPLAWDRLSTPLPAWRALLPETHAPDEIAGRLEDDWVVKPALGHEGHNIGIFGVNDPTDWTRIRKAAMRDRQAWAAQRRFQTLPVETPDGPLYPCLGIYVIDGRVAGAYGRVARRPLIDDHSREVAIFVRRSTAGN